MKTQYVEIDPDNPKKILLKTWDKRFREVYGSIPTASYKRKIDAWHFNLTWQTCLAISNTLGPSGLEVGPNLKEWTAKTFEELIQPAYELRNQVQADGYENLFPHQRADVAFLSHVKRGILANDPGVGKTRSAISSVMRLHELGENVFPVLITCPNSTKIGWGREIEEVWPGAKVVVVNGTVTQRRKQLAEKAHFYVMNWEAVAGHSRLEPYGSITLKRCEACGGNNPKVSAASCDVHIKELNEIDFQTVIGDELHRIMDPSTKTSRSFKAATGDAPFRIGMTATPIANDISNIYSILNWLFPEAYPSKSSFISRYCETMPQQWGQDLILGLKENRKQEFYNGLDPFFRRMTKEVVLPFLPPIIRERREVVLGKKQMDAYKMMKKKMFSDIEGDALIASNPLQKAIRLQQFASSYAEIKYMTIPDPKTNEPIEKVVVKLSEPSSLLDTFMDDLPGFGEESIIVFAQSKQLLYLLANRLKKANIPYGMLTGDQSSEERQYWMDTFQAGDVQLILVTVQAGGTGVTLTKASSMVYLQRPYSHINNEQSEGRGHRIGSEIHESVRIIDYVATGTVQERVLDALDKKDGNAQEVLRDDAFVEMILAEEAKTV